MKTGRASELAEWAVAAIEADPTASVLIATIDPDRARRILDDVQRRMAGGVLRRTTQEIVVPAGGRIRAVSPPGGRGRVVDLVLCDPDGGDDLRLAFGPCEVAR